MKNVLPAMAFLALVSCKPEAKSCAADVRPAGGNTFIYTYDSQEAERLGADRHGMKQYVIAFLRNATGSSAENAADAKTAREHRKFIEGLEKSGKLSLLGTGKDDLHEMLLLNVNTVEDAQKLLKTDPAIKSGTLVTELHSWYAPAALSEIPERSKIYTKEKL